jgi:hypothetical protein
MGTGGGSGNQALFMVLAQSAITNIGQLDTYWSLQRRHPDQVRWLDLAHHATKDDARAALDAVVGGEHADRHELRVEHVRRRPS